jgi:hypothetical protein
MKFVRMIQVVLQSACVEVILQKSLPVAQLCYAQNSAGMLNASLLIRFQHVYAVILPWSPLRVVPKDANVQNISSAGLETHALVSLEELFQIA